MKVLRAVVMLAGLLQVESSNFEGVLCRKFNALIRAAYGFALTEELKNSNFEAGRKFAAVGYRFPLTPVSSQLNK